MAPFIIILKPIVEREHVLLNNNVATKESLPRGCFDVDKMRAGTLNKRFTTEQLGLAEKIVTKPS